MRRIEIYRFCICCCKLCETLHRFFLPPLPSTPRDTFIHAQLFIVYALRKIRRERKREKEREREKGRDRELFCSSLQRKQMKIILAPDGIAQFKKRYRSERDSKVSQTQSTRFLPVFFFFFFIMAITRPSLHSARWIKVTERLHRLIFTKNVRVCVSFLPPRSCR